MNYEIAREALARGHRVTLLACDVAPDLREHPHVRWVPVSCSRLPTQLVRNQVFAHRAARWLRRHRSTFDVLHLNGSVTWVPGDVNASHMVHHAWLRSPQHTSRVHRNPYGLYHWVMSALNVASERQAYRRARVVVAVSEQVKQQLMEIGVADADIRVITNGVDLEEFSPGASDRAVLGLPGGVPLAVFVGDLRLPLKNLDTVLRAMLRFPELHLAVVGATDGSPYVSLAERLGLAPRAHFLGFRNDVAEIMRAADALVFPSRFEAFSLVVLEALASGLPVITARTVGAAELVTPGCGIVLEDPNDEAALAAALHGVLDDPARTKALGRQAREVAEQHSWSRMATAYVQLYEETATRAARG